jgi:transcriptional regulator with XRE-family HTH domain
MVDTETGIRTLTVIEEPGKLELKSQFIDLRAKGWSYSRIARKLKVSKNTLANWSSELEGEIASLKAMELEALYEKYYLTKEARIKLLGGQLKEIQEELKARKLDSVSTDKLLELELKIYQALQSEYVEVRPLSDQEIEELRA